jgi:sulfur carrier protein
MDRWPAVDWRRRRNQKENFKGAKKMTITVAGEKKEYKDGLTLPELIELEKVDMPDYVTVSINEEFVETEKKAETVLKDGDNVEFLYFMGGGC